MRKYIKGGFTLVELIIVITILAILATIGFMSFQSYTIDARDGKRVTDLGVLRKGVEIYGTKNQTLLNPDNYTTISGASLQGYAGINVLKTLRISDDVKDPKDKEYYTYSIDLARKKYQLLSMLEKQQFAYNKILNQSYARDYTGRIPYTLGRTFGIYLSGATQTPVQEGNSGTTITNTGSLTLITSNTGTNSGGSGGGKNYSCATQANYPNATFTVGAPTITNQDWQNTNSSNPCYYTCINGYTGNDCATAPITTVNATCGTSNGSSVATAPTSNLCGDGTIPTVSGTGPWAWTCIGTGIPKGTNISCNANKFICGTDTISAGGYTYGTVFLAGKCWTIGSMKHGTLLANGSTTQADINTIEKWCPMPNGTSSGTTSIALNCNTYSGALYTWYEAMGLSDTQTTITTEDTTKSVCGQLGTGWHLPSDSDYIALTTDGATGWTGNKLSGLISSLSGYRNTDGSFLFLAFSGYWWSSTRVSTSNAYGRSLVSGGSTVIMYNGSKLIGFSVLCLKN